MIMPHISPAADHPPSQPGDGTSPQQELAELSGLVAGHFRRRETREAAEGYMRSLLYQTAHSNTWRLAALAGDESPWRMQRLLTKARWGEQAVHRTVVEWLTGRLGHPAATLRLSQGHVPKKGTRTVAVARQYRDATGRVENCQAMVLSFYLSPRGHALLDRELYLPREWCADPTRCRSAGVPQDRLQHSTPGQLARCLVARARDWGVPFSWVTGSVIHGLDEKLRSWLEHEGVRYVLAVPWQEFEEKASLRRAEAAEQPHVWQAAGARWTHQALTVRGNWMLGLLTGSPGAGCRPERFLTHSPVGTATSELAAVASCRPTAPTALGADGLHGHELRTWTAWYRHTGLSLAALAAIAVARRRDTPADAVPLPAQKKQTPVGDHFCTAGQSQP